MAATANASYAALKQQCEAAVVRWEWATSERYSHQPHYFECHRFTRGRALKIKPKRPQGMTAHGFDSDGRLVVVRGYTSLPQVRFTETFSVHLKDAIEDYHYDYDPQKQYINVGRFTLQHGRVMTLERRYAGGTSAASTFVYGHGVLTAVELPTMRYELVHDDLGRLTDVSWVEGKSRSQIFHKAQKGEGLAALLPVIQQRLLTAAVGAVGRLKLKEPIYALALVIDTEAYEHMLPPALAVARESERAGFIAAPRPRRADATLRDYLWSPPEWKNDQYRALALGDTELFALCKKANFEIWQKERFAAARKVCDTVAKALQKRDLGVAVSDDFVCFVVDVSSGDGAKWLRKHAPKARVKGLIARRWL